MQLTGERLIAADRSTIWDALNDPSILRHCIPGCQSLEREPDGKLRATVEIRIGPIGARFLGVVTLSDIDAPNGYTITGEGQGGTVGHAKGSAKVQLSDQADGTLLAYTVSAEVGGRLAQLGGPIIDATARQLADKFFRTFDQQVSKPSPAISAPKTAADASSSAVGSHGYSGPSRQHGGFPAAWILAVTVAALAGFLAGREQGANGADWMGLAIGFAFFIVGAAAFEFGRRVSAPVILLDPAALARLLDRDRA